MTDRENSISNPQSENLPLATIVSGLIVISLLTLLVGVFWTVILKKGEGEDTSQEDSRYNDWGLYENESFNLSFRYPKDWIVEDRLDCDTSPKFCGFIRVVSDSYVWELILDPTISGGRFGYSIEIVPPSDTYTSDVTPDEFKDKMVSRFITQENLEEMYGEDISNVYSLSGESWEGAVLFQDEEKGMLGFGPGEMYDDIEGNYFGIKYYYQSQTDDFSDLPLKDDETLYYMLNIFNEISSSLELGN